MEPDIIQLLRTIGDAELLHRLSALVSQSHRLESELVAHIGEVDERKLYAGQACSSMFVYCTERLHLSEAEAYLRITVARAARKHAVLLEMLRDGGLHLRAIALLAPLLTDENRDSLLRRATHKSKREVEELVAELSPRPDVAARIRRLPERSGQVPPEKRGQSQPGELCPGRVDGTAADSLHALVPRGGESRETPGFCQPPRQDSPLLPEGSPRQDISPRPATEPLSPGRYKVQFTASAELKEKIERLTALMRSEVPDGDVARIIDQAVTEKLQRLEARRFGATSAPHRKLAQSRTTPTSRAIPAAVRRAVHERDGGRCAYVNAAGRRCTEETRLEFHHRHPFGMGGDHRVENVSLLCRAHNAYIAELDYGRSKMRMHLAVLVGGGTGGREGPH